MSLKIENEEIRRLAGELASITGDNSCVTGGKYRKHFGAHSQRGNPALAICLSEVRDEKAKCDCL